MWYINSKCFCFSTFSQKMALVIQKPFAQKLLEDEHLGILKKTQSTYDKTFVNVYYKKNSF